VDNINYHESWDQLAAASLPFLQILVATGIKTGILASLIEKTMGYLKEIKICFTDHGDTNNKRFIRAIYQNCPNLKYLKLYLLPKLSETMAESESPKPWSETPAVT
jgi:hypothetical protein